MSHSHLSSLINVPITQLPSVLLLLPVPSFLFPLSPSLKQQTVKLKKKLRGGGPMAEDEPILLLIVTDDLRIIVDRWTVLELELEWEWEWYEDVIVPVIGARRLLNMMLKVLLAAEIIVLVVTRHWL